MTALKSEVWKQKVCNSGNTATTETVEMQSVGLYLTDVIIFLWKPFTQTPAHRTGNSYLQKNRSLTLPYYASSASYKTEGKYEHEKEKRSTCRQVSKYFLILYHIFGK